MKKTKHTKHHLKALFFLTLVFVSFATFAEPLQEEEANLTSIYKKSIAVMDREEGGCYINLESLTRKCNLEEQKEFQVLIAQTDTVSHLSFIESGSKIMSVVTDFMTDMMCGMRSNDQTCEYLVKLLTGGLVAGGLFILIPPTAVIGKVIVFSGVGGIIIVTGFYQFEKWLSSN